LLKLGLENLTVIRVGYIFEDATEGERIRVDLHHPFGPDQMARLPLQPLVGSGEQRIQPIYIEDVVDATLADTKGVQIINGVGHQVVTQKEFFSFFRGLVGKKFRPIFLPYALAEHLVSCVSMGHAAPYTVNICKALDPRRNPDVTKTNKGLFDAQPIERLIGRKTVTMEEVYKQYEDKMVEYPVPPIFGYGKKLFSSKKFWIGLPKAALESLKERVTITLPEDVRMVEIGTYLFFYQVNNNNEGIDCR